VTSATDAYVSRTRDEIAALDVRLLATINARIRKVAELHRHKAEHGLPLVDPEREAWLMSYLQRVNRGPLSDEGVGELIRFVLDLVRRENARD
jgi:chorismate mutase